MLVSSPSDMAKVLICDECISLCMDVVKESYGQKGITPQLPDWRAESIKLKQESLHCARGSASSRTRKRSDRTFRPRQRL
jgi:hypothetical protein